MARRRFTFWLNDNKELENQVIGEVYQLKQVRSFSSAIRDGIRLIVDLRAGNLDVLFSLFPFVKLEILELMRDVKSDSPDDNSSDDIKAQIARLEQLILSQGVNKDSPVIKPLGGLQPLSNGINQIGGMKPIQAPVFDDSDDDDLLIVTKDTESGGRATANFLRSMMALQQ